jgi:hypothetical protein
MASEKKYVVVQEVLTSKAFAVGSDSGSLKRTESIMNEKAAEGYKLHSFSTAAISGDKERRILATMVFEKIE